MALDDVFSGNIGAGLMFGLGAAVVAPLAVKVLRPAAKAVIKGGISLYEGSGIGDTMGDLTAEARAELEQSRREAADRRESAESAGAEHREQRGQIGKRGAPQPA